MLLRVFLGRLQQAEHFPIRSVDRLPLLQFCFTGDERLAQCAVHCGALIDHPHFEQIRADLFFHVLQTAGTLQSHLKASCDLTRPAQPRRLGGV